MSEKKLTVIDFFCGAGGFSEGFRQQGFEILQGIDCWQPAVDTFNFNFKTNHKSKNILDFYNSIEEILTLPDTDIIIGSPPCVSFSSSNKSGKADKSLGVQLTECFLRIVAVKKHQKDSTLKAWYMENVVNSKRYLQREYTFHDLKLTDWAKQNRISPQKVAITLDGNSTIINSADYGSHQNRKRVISGEIIKVGKLIIPTPTHQLPESEGCLKKYNTLGMLKSSFPSPFSKSSNKIVKDPQYNSEIKLNEITDHFYDTGIYENEWRLSNYWKTNHPYMGKMSFPENVDKPSRTVTATKIANSRESLIYKSEVNRKGDGEYRTPTVREAAIIMGFPISYQFIGAENTKWRLVGNAVCPSVSRALAKSFLENYDSSLIQDSPILLKEVNTDGILNLNTFTLKTFDTPPIRNKGARFRRHPFKDGNMTIALSNYDIEVNSKEIGEWRVTAFYGTGEGFITSNYPVDYYKYLEPIIEKNFKDGKKFIEIINNGFSEKIASKELLQEMYEKQTSLEAFLEPTKLVDEVSKIVSIYAKSKEVFIQNGTKVFEKKSVPKTQLYALYALNKIISKSNFISHE